MTSLIVIFALLSAAVAALCAFTDGALLAIDLDMPASPRITMPEDREPTARSIDFHGRNLPFENQ